MTVFCLDTDEDGYSDADPGGPYGVTQWFSHPVGFADAFPADNTQWTAQMAMAMETIGMTPHGILHMRLGELDMATTNQRSRCLSVHYRNFFNRSIWLS